MGSVAGAKGQALTLELLDEDVGHYSIGDWRQRNVTLFDILAERGHLDLDVVSRPALSFLTTRLINIRVGAAVDPQNAGHVRAQNENVIHFGLAADVPKAVMTISLVAGFIHDLNKAFREPLRTDDLAVRDADGNIVPVMSSIAEIVGLNHLGERTRRALTGATRLSRQALDAEVATAIDRCIVHHGLGSSRFVRELVEGQNTWWGHEFVDPDTGRKKLVHPPQPELTLASVIHDLADSVQQMQGGVAWLMKYPSGYWKDSGRSFAEMLSGLDGDIEQGVSMSLAHQIRVETDTCQKIIADGVKAGVVSSTQKEALLSALDIAIMSSRQWLDDAPEHLANVDGDSVYHDLARTLGGRPEEAHARMKTAVPGTVQADELEEALWQSARRLDRVRAARLSTEIHVDRSNVDAP